MPHRSAPLSASPPAAALQAVPAWDDLRGLLDRASDVVYRYRLRPTAGFDYVSAGSRRVTGYTPEEHYADPGLILGLVHRDDRPLVRTLLEQGASDLPTVVRWVRKDGSVSWMELRTTSIRDVRGEVTALEAVAREMHDPTAGTGPSIRVLGDVRIDLERSRVFVAGEPLRLTPAEFRVFVLLTDRAGSVVSRRAIIEALWDSPHIGAGRVCEVHISTLRRKLERDPPRPRRIETVRGRGYRFIPA
jgi:PAS domain S-box-containing protein